MSKEKEVTLRLWPREVQAVKHSLRIAAEYAKASAIRTLTSGSHPAAQHYLMMRPEFLGVLKEIKKQYTHESDVDDTCPDCGEDTSVCECEDLEDEE